MAAVASKNLFDLLGNDVEDENDVPKPPMKEIVKKTTTSKKADAPPLRPTATDDSGRGGATRRPRGEGNDGAFRDRNNGRQNNRSRPTDETGGVSQRGDRPYRGRGGGGGGRGGRGREYDRHSATNRTDTEKQVSQGWGNNKSEWTEEQAGENLAQAEATEEATTTAVEGEPAAGTTEAAPAQETEEEEDKRVSFAEYQAQLRARAPVEELPEARSANEGARDAKKWAAAKELVKEEDEDYFAGGKFKQKSQKSRKEKQVVEIDHGFVDPRSTRRTSSDRGGRGGGGRGGPRGDRPSRGGRGDFRGEYRGGRGGSGPRGGSGGGLNVQDESAFPSLGK